MKLYSYEQQILLNVYSLIENYNSLREFGYSDNLVSTDDNFELHKIINNLFTRLNVRLKEYDADRLYGMKSDRNWNYHLYVRYISDNRVVRVKITELKKAEIC